MMEFDAEPRPDQSQSQTQFPIGILQDQDRYCLEQKIGQGGMGEVFLATDLRLSKQVALKLLSSDLINAEAACQRFKQECAICAALKSPHIVQVSDYGITTSGYPFYVMEYLQGETLRQRLLRSPQLSIEQITSIVSQICAGLQVAHSGVRLGMSLADQQSRSSGLIKVIHRDLKPDNIFLVPTALGDLVKIIDFGIAKLRSLQADTSETTQSLLGTSHYAAPEQFETAEIDERADLYSLGIILYEMLTGTDPYGLGFNSRLVSNTAWLTAHLTKPVLPLRSQAGCEQLPVALETVVLRALAKSPEQRFASAEAFNQAFQAAATSNTGSCDPIPGSRRRRFADLAPVAAVSLTILTIGGIVGFNYFLRADSSVQQFSQPIRTLPKTLSQTLLGHQAAVWAVALASDEKTLISGDEAGVIKVWDIQTGQLERTLTGQQGAVRALSLSLDQRYLASGGDKIQIWDMQTGLLHSTYDQPVWAVALSQDHKTLVSGSQDELLRIWDLNQAGQFRTLSGHTAAVYTVAISPDQTQIVSGSHDQTVKIWNMRSGTLIHTFSGHRDAVRSVAFGADNNLIASASWDKTVKIWNTQTKTLVHTLTGHRDRVIAVAFSKDGRTLASASRDRTLKLWDVQSGSLLQTLEGHTDWVLSVELSRDGKPLVSGSSDRTIKIWR